MSLQEWISTNFYNDAGNWPIYLMVVFISFVILGVSIYFHELGHWVYFKAKLKKNIKIRFIYEKITKFYWIAGEPADYENLSKRHYHDMMMFGILTGFFPILASAFVWTPFALLVIPYMAGSWSDIKQMMAFVEKRLDE